MKRNVNWCKFLIALVMVMAVGFPAHAGIFDWLLGEPEPTAAATPQPAEQTAVTLPPVEKLTDDAPTAAAAATPSATEAPIPEASMEEDGMLRVELRSLDLPSQLHLTLAGVYAVEADPGFRFDRGTQVTLSAAEGSIFMSVGGLTLDMGPAVTLTRHRAEEGAENGLYIEQSEKQTLYAGDLSVSVQGDGLRAVLTIQVEDYLYGVVAYEMSDSFPIEALKAQAVAARTYALQRKSRMARKDYDVVDTTADQVFKGLDRETVNVIRAVDETRGVVELEDGNFAVCYYTASNGGQTALPSQILGSTEGEAGLAVTDDPYDLENPRSLVSEVTFSADVRDNADLKRMLEEALGQTLAEAGYAPGEWEMVSVDSLEPVDPAFEGSRMYRSLRFGLKVKLLMPIVEEETDDALQAATSEEAQTAEIAGAASQEPTGEPTAEPTAVPAQTPGEWTLSDEPVYVTLDVYSQIKDGLGMGLSGLDCELISAERQLDAEGEIQGFRLLMRRFGHGVGMSQRGAQWMAGHYGWTWQQILSFYYPSLTLSRIDWPEEALTDLAELPAGVGAARPEPTPTPTPVPLPPLEEGEHYAQVTANMLNLRERPTTASRAIDQLPQGRRVIVSTEPDADGWVRVRTGDAEGFVKAEYLIGE